MYPKKYFKKYIGLSGLFTVFMALGIAILSFRTLIYKAITSKIFVLEPDTYSFQLWERNPMPMSLKIYLFNWTNAAETKNSSVKPIMQEIGPYFFDETKEKVNITWDSDNGTVTFYHLKKWWFNQEKSNGKLNDNVTSVNPIALLSVLTAKNWNYFLKKALQVMHSSMKITSYSTHKVEEVLFSGYEDQLLNVAKSLPFANLQIPDFDKFGWFYTRNNSETYEGEFTMDTGIKGQLGQLYRWKGMEQTPYYREGCGKVTGSAGEYFPTNLTKETIIKFFTPDLCRYVELEFEKEVVISGVLGYKYVAGDRFLDNGTKIPENKCFCEGKCMPYGGLNISVCRYGSPAFVSLPHFYKADPHYTRLIHGMNSQEDLHEFAMIFEPRTGMPLRIAARLQVNLLMQSVPGIRSFEDLPEAYLPIFWFEQVLDVPGQFIFYIKFLINLEYICLTVGIILIFGSMICKIGLCYKLYNTKIFRNKIRRKQPIKEEIPLNGK